MRTNKLEQETVSMAMHRPMNVRTIDLRPKYFTNRQLASIYKAVRLNPDGGILDWYSAAKNEFGYRGTVNQISEIYSNGCVLFTPNFFKRNAESMHKYYLRKKIGYYAGRIAKVGAAKVDYQELMKYATAYENLGAENDRGINNAVEHKKYLIDHPQPQGPKTGFKELDYCLVNGLSGGMIMTVGAPTSGGKTAFAANVASNILDECHENHQPIRIDYFAEEMTNDTILDRFISNRTGLSDWQLGNETRCIKNRNARIAVYKASKQIQDQGLYIYMDYEMPKILSTIRRHAAGRKPNTYIAIVDYVGIVAPDEAHQRDPRYRQVANICDNFEHVAGKFGVPIIMLSQVNRQVAARDSNELFISDLTDSSSIGNDSDVVLLIYKDKKDDPRHRIIKVAKNRSGITKKIPFEFYGGHMMFVEEDSKIKGLKSKLDKRGFNND